MGYRREPIAVGEWYHCYNRGIDKRKVFESERDCERFLQALYLCNGDGAYGRNDFEHFTHGRIFSIERGKPIVSIAAYSLIPNHFHIFMQEIVEGGISKFMHRLGTSYTMYFNIKNSRTGNLFNKPFRSRHVLTEQYFRHVPNYIHLNAAAIFDPEWKKGGSMSTRKIEQKLKEYRFASFIDYCGSPRIERSILDESAVGILKHNISASREMIEEAADYYKTLV